MLHGCRIDRHVTMSFVPRRSSDRQGPSPPKSDGRRRVFCCRRRETTGPPACAWRILDHKCDARLARRGFLAHNRFRRRCTCCSHEARLENSAKSLAIEERFLICRDDARAVNDGRLPSQLVVPEPPLVQVCEVREHHTNQANPVQMALPCIRYPTLAATQNNNGLSRQNL